jgi:hypothetical protein
LVSSFPVPNVVPASADASELVTSWQGSSEVAAPDWLAGAELGAAADAGDGGAAAPALTDDELVVAGELQAVSSRAEEMTARAAGVRRMGVSPRIGDQRIERDVARAAHP